LLDRLDLIQKQQGIGNPKDWPKAAIPEGDWQHALAWNVTAKRADISKAHIHTKLGTTLMLNPGKTGPQVKTQSPLSTGAAAIPLSKWGRSRFLPRFGGHSTRKTPDPFPNSADKCRRANGTASQDVGE
jgi:hypothetical protein